MTDALLILHAKPRAGAPLSLAQKRYNALLSELQQLREWLRLWDEALPPYRLQHARVLDPLLARIEAAQRQQLRRLDHLLAEGGWSNTDRHTLTVLLAEGIHDFLLHHPGDPEVLTLRQRQGLDDAATQARAVAALRALVVSLTGQPESDFDGLDSRAALEQALRDALHPPSRRASRERGASAGGDPAARSGAAHTGADESRDAAASASQKRRPGAAQRRAQARQAQVASQSVRDIFRKLASALHPDRESDPVERDRKTALMQQVNRAYEAGDLPTLLRLQLDLEQIDAEHVAQASDERLARYNAVLADQVESLTGEVARCRRRFCAEFGWNVDPDDLQPHRIGEWVSKGCKALNAELSAIERELDLMSDRTRCERWLIQVRRVGR